VKTLRILGTRGVPAAHGGFETFAEQLALYLVERGWKVVVYCQHEGHGPAYDDSWQGVDRHNIPVGGNGSLSSVKFDWLATRHAAHHRDLCLTLGYNTAVFCLLLRLAGVPNVINMDGIEWRRAKWGLLAKTWFWLNEWAGSWLGNHLVADHPDIARHLSRAVPLSKITMIPYGADPLHALPETAVRNLGLEPGRYLTLIASRCQRGVRLAVLGAYRDDHAYQRAVREAASAEVSFLGAIYDKPVVQALRKHCLAYVHGHRVGGTNPSLVEALGAGNAVLAHDNGFNRWVAGDAARYFNDADQFAALLDELKLSTSPLQPLRAAANRRFENMFTWTTVLQEYESLLKQWLPSRGV